METVLLEVDGSNPVTLSMLCPILQNLVRPVVEEFVHHVGRDVSRQCTIRFRRV
jgi:NAD-specific glutamate dehydrogenase